MSTGKSGDLYDSTDASRGQDLGVISDISDYKFPDDWEGGSWDNITETTSGPYCIGDSIDVVGVFSGTAINFNYIKKHDGNYSREGSTNVNFIASQGGTFTYEAASAGTGEIKLSYAAPFTTLTNEGSIYSVTFTINPYKVDITGYNYDGINDNVTINYDIYCGTPDYSVELYRDVDSTAEFVDSETRTSTGSYSITDTNPHSNDNSDDYRIEVTDGGGGGTKVTDTQTVNFPN